MTSESIDLVLDGWEEASTQLPRLAEVFYARLFEIAPQTRSMFPADMTAQKVKFTTMMTWIVQHLDNAPALVPEVAELGKRHVGYGARADHYVLIGDSLLWALADVLGPRFTDEMRAAWREAYLLLAGLMARGAAS